MNMSAVLRMRIRQGARGDSVARPPSRTCCRPRTRVLARFGGRGQVLDRPDVEIKQSGWDESTNTNAAGPALKTEADKGSGGRQRNSGFGGGDYRVLLLNSPAHSEKAVIRAITAVVPGTAEEHARNCYMTSQSLGMAIVITALKEHAEHYAQQLYRFGCKAAMEPDTTTL